MAVHACTTRCTVQHSRTPHGGNVCQPDSGTPQVAVRAMPRPLLGPRWGTLVHTVVNREEYPYRTKIHTQTHTKGEQETISCQYRLTNVIIFDLNAIRAYSCYINPCLQPDTLALHA